MFASSLKGLFARISDEGGGIDRSLLDRVWQYGYTTNSKPKSPSNSTTSSFTSFWMESQEMARSDLSGYGFGLPFSRLHARYFGGDLQLVSIPAFGVDVFLTTKKLDRQMWSETEKTERLEYTEPEVSRRTAY